MIEAITNEDNFRLWKFIAFNQMTPKDFLNKLKKNLNILREREAKYGSNAPLDLLNQISDHEKAIELTEQRDRDELSKTEWQNALEPLLITIELRSAAASDITPNDIDLIRSFENETAIVQQIVREQPTHWELLLALELLRPRLNQIKREYSDLRRGLIFKPFTMLDKTQFLDWMKKRGKELENLVSLLKVAVEEEFNQSLGKLGETGNALEIKRAIDKIIFGCQSLLDWEIDNEFTQFPDECEQIKQKTRGWTEAVVNELEKLPMDIAKLLDEPNPKGMYRINMVAKFPENADEILLDIQRLSDQNYF